MSITALTPPQAASAAWIRPAGRQSLISEDTPIRGLTAVGKYLFDRGVAALALLFFAPLLFGIAVAIRATTRGPALISQLRIGKDGQLFRLYKFRTLSFDPQSRAEDQVIEETTAIVEESDSGLLGIVRENVKLTPIGRWLRLTGLDELPQLMNVLRGEMSLVGPRPRLPFEVAAMSRDELRLLLVRPGLAGLPQSLRGGATPAQARILDAAYLDNWSFALDLVILWQTFWNVLGWRAQLDDTMDHDNHAGHFA